MKSMTKLIAPREMDLTCRALVKRQKKRKKKEKRRVSMTLRTSVEGKGKKDFTV